MKDHGSSWNRKIWQVIVKQFPFGCRGSKVGHLKSEVFHFGGERDVGRYKVKHHQGEKLQI